MAIRMDAAIVRLAMLLSLALVCGVAVAGEVIVVPLTPGGASAPSDPAQANRDATIDNANKARAYSDPNSGSHNVIILAPGGGNSTADKNREALLRNRMRSNNQSQGNKDGSRSGNTLVILPGTPAGTPDSRSALDSAMDRAHAYSDDGGRRPCTNASVSVGTVGNVVVIDRSGDATSAAQGVNTVAVGGCR